MTWHVGIDEAGYGPNLGPLVQVAIGFCHADEPACIWQSLRSVVRRADRSRDSRLVIDDSKKVYGSSGKLRALELGVLATLFPSDTLWPIPLEDVLRVIAPEASIELAAEPWFQGRDLIPVAAESAQITDASRRFQTEGAACGYASFRSIGRITPPALFNALLAERDNKADVLSNGLRWLVRATLRIDQSPVVFAIDRQGGRMYHVALLQSACPDSWIEVVEETESCCRYRAARPRELRWSFEVAAESRHFTVALASMTAKYLREVLMAQFNRFWQQHVPDLKPTAGYPVDAMRFMAAIRPAMNRLGIDEAAVWRRK